MAIAPGTYKLGPDNGDLLVHTRRQGAAAKAGHDLELIVSQWTATLNVGDATSLRLSADSSSLHVRHGRGGINALDEDDKGNIRQTIEDEVLKHTPIEFRSSEIESDGDRMRVIGELELNGRTHPLTLELETDRDTLTGHATLKQTAWGMKPYTTLFGALKVADEVVITVAASLQSA